MSYVTHSELSEHASLASKQVHVRILCNKFTPSSVLSHGKMGLKTITNTKLQRLLNA